MSRSIRMGSGNRKGVGGSFVVWCRRDDGDRVVTVCDTPTAAIRRCRRLYSGYVTSGDSWRILYSQRS
jgi:hypothetical protein